MALWPRLRGQPPPPAAAARQQRRRAVAMDSATDATSSRADEEATAALTELAGEGGGSGTSRAQGGTMQADSRAQAS